MVVSRRVGSCRVGWRAVGGDGGVGVYVPLNVKGRPPERPSLSIMRDRRSCDTDGKASRRSNHVNSRSLFFRLESVSMERSRKLCSAQPS